VRECEADDDPVAPDAAPALGEVPEEGEEALIDPRQLRDRPLERQRGGLPGRAGEQTRGDLRPRLQRPQQPRVEHGHAGRCADRPAQLGGNERAVVVAEPRDVARAEEVGRDAAGHQDVADDRALGDQEAHGTVGAGQIEG